MQYIALLVKIQFYLQQHSDTRVIIRFIVFLMRNSIKNFIRFRLNNGHTSKFGLLVFFVIMSIEPAMSQY